MISSSLPIKGKERSLSNPNNSVNSFELEEIMLNFTEPLFPPNFSQSPPEFIDTDPFTLVNYYNEQLDGAPANIESNLPLILDRNTAQQLLTDALKMGDNYCRDLVSLLLDENPLFAEQQAEISQLFAQSQAILLPCKLHAAILVSMQYILQNVLALIDSSPENSFADNEDFYEQVVTCCLATQANDLPHEFNNHVGKYLGDGKLREEASEKCFRALRPYLPRNNENARRGYFAISEEVPISSLREKIERDIKQIHEARNNAQVMFELLAKEGGSQELEDRLNIEKRKRRQQLVKSILQTSNNEREVGLPYAYKGRFTEEQLLALASLVPHDAVIDKDTGNNVALLTLECGNVLIYKEFFAANKGASANKGHPNRWGITAEDYEQAFFWDDQTVREQAKNLIKKKDPRGWVLSKVEKQVHQYLQEWHKKNYRLNQKTENQDLAEKIVVTLIKLFNNEALFATRPYEAQACLDLTYEARQDTPIDFYGLLKKMHSNGSDKRGLVNGSHLYKIMEECLSFLKENKKDFLILVNPNQELTAQIKELRKNQQLAENKYRLDLREQKEEFEQKLHDQQQQLQERVRRENTLQQQIEAQQQRHEAQIQQQALQFEEKLHVQQQRHDGQIKQQTQEFEHKWQTQQQQMETIAAALKEMQMEKNKETLVAENATVRQGRPLSYGFY